MSNINAEIKWQGNDNAWFTTNAAIVYPANIQIFHEDGRYKFTDGILALSDLPWRGDSSGTVTSVNGEAGVVVLTTGDISEDTDKNYVTDAELTVLQNTSGTNTGDETASRIAEINHGTSAKTTLVDADELTGQDSESSFSLIRATCLNVYNYLKTKFDLVYATLASPTFTGTVTTPAILVSSETASTIAIIDASKNIKSAITITYPNLTELTHIKNVTSPIQPQINAQLYNFSDIEFSAWWTPPTLTKSLQASWSGVVWFFPFSIGHTKIITRISLDVVTVSAGGTFRMSLYDADSNGDIGNIVEDSGDISTATSGSKSFTLTNPKTLSSSSKMIWFAFEASNNTIGMRSATLINILNQRGGAGIGVRTIAQAYGALPANGSTATDNSSQVTVLPSLKIQ